MTKRICLYTALLSLLAVQSSGQNSTGTTPALVGLDGVYIFVEPLAPEVEEKGITDVVLGAEVERRLRERGIPVLDLSPEGQLAPGTPTLYLQVTALADEHTDECVYAIRLELIQGVRLTRAEAAPEFPAATWGAGGVGIGGRKWRETIIEDVVGFTDQFVAAYIAANPQAGVQEE